MNDDNRLTANLYPTVTPEAAPVPLSDQMADDAAPPKERPAGAPDLWPFQQLHRRRRAELLRAFGSIQAVTDALPANATEPDVTDEAAMGQAAAAYDMLADLEDILRIAARDEEAFDDWAATAPDEDLAALATWYMDRFAVGEAPASST